MRSGEGLIGKTRAWPNQVGNIRIDVDLIEEIELTEPLPACIAEMLVAVCNGSRKLLRI